MPLRSSHTVTMVILRASGEVNEVDMEHREIREVLGCGPSLLACFASDVFGWVRSDGQGPVNKHQLPFDEVHGDIVLCRIDRSSQPEPEPYTAKDYRKWRREQIPGEPHAAEDDDDDDDDDDESDEDDESSEEELEQLPANAVKERLVELGLPTGGSKWEMLARLQQALAADDGDEQLVDLSSLRPDSLAKLCALNELRADGPPAALASRLQQPRADGPLDARFRLVTAESALKARDALLSDVKKPPRRVAAPAAQPGGASSSSAAAATEPSAPRRQPRERAPPPPPPEPIKPVGQCERDPRCIRGSRHMGRGGHCKLADEAEWENGKRPLDGDLVPDDAGKIRALNNSGRPIPPPRKGRGQCERHPLCTRGFRHCGHGGKCALRKPLPGEVIDPQYLEHLKPKGSGSSSAAPASASASVDGDNESQGGEESQGEEDEEVVAKRRAAEYDMPCERNPNCIRGYKHRGKGGACSTVRANLKKYR